VKYEIEMRYKPSIPGNIKHWQVFENDQQIKKFMEVIYEFENTHIDSNDEEDSKLMVEGENEITLEFNEYMVEHKVLHLKNNFIPKGLVPLDQLFDINDVPVKPIVLP
jgi:hypothetical protein